MDCEISAWQAAFISAICFLFGLFLGIFITDEELSEIKECYQVEKEFNVTLPKCKGLFDY